LDLVLRVVNFRFGLCLPEDDGPPVQPDLVRLDDVTKEVEGVLVTTVARTPAQHPSQVIP
jgi:hypothetical protein